MIRGAVVQVPVTATVAEAEGLYLFSIKDNQYIKPSSLYHLNLI